MQLSFFGAGTEPAGPDDLAGLLAGPGQVVRADAGTRLSVVLRVPAGHDSWRTDALIHAFEGAGLAGEVAETVDGLTAVRTNFVPELSELAKTWTRGAMKVPPAGFTLTGAQLRLWAIAAGWHDEVGYLLALGESDESAWSGSGAALQSAGVSASLVGARAGGPAYRINGQRRLAKLRELIGDPPEGAPPDDWP